MPDFTIESGWWCDSNEGWSTEIVGSKGDVYKVFWEHDYRPEATVQMRYRCTCPGFVHRGKCKHIAMAQAKHCRWNEEMSTGAQADEGPNGPVCPSCGGPVRAFRIAV